MKKFVTLAAAIGVCLPLSSAQGEDQAAKAVADQPAAADEAEAVPSRMEQAKEAAIQAGDALSEKAGEAYDATKKAAGEAAAATGDALKKAGTATANAMNQASDAIEGKIEEMNKAEEAEGAASDAEKSAAPQSP